MNTPPMQAQINQCIEVYERITGFSNGKGILANVMAWSEFVRSGFTSEQLEFVLKHLMREIKKGERKLGCLRISTLILDTQRFGEELNMAQAMHRNAKPQVTPKQQAVTEFRRFPVVTATVEAKPIGHYMEALRKAAS